MQCDTLWSNGGEGCLECRLVGVLHEKRGKGGRGEVRPNNYYVITLSRQSEREREWSYWEEEATRRPAYIRSPHHDLWSRAGRMSSLWGRCLRRSFSPFLCSSARSGQVPRLSVKGQRVTERYRII